MAKLPDQNTHTSASMVIRVRGRDVGRAQGVNITADFGVEPVMEGIGSINPAEHVPLQYRADLSIDTFLIRLRSASPGKPGIQDVLGVPINDLILGTEPFDLVILDKVTQAVIFSAERCTWTNLSIDIRFGSITGKNARASAIRLRQAPEFEPTVDPNSVPGLLVT